MRNNKYNKKKLQKYYMTCKDYFDKLSKKDFDQWFSSYCSVLKTGKDRILDAGCGTGQVVNRLADDRVCPVGVDISPVGIQIASKQGTGVFVVASVNNLPFQNNSFNTVGFYDFLEHVCHPETCLNEMVRVLKVYGKIVALAPNFLQVIGLSHPYHWHMSGVKQRMLNLCNLVRKDIICKVSSRRMRFEFMQPYLDPKGEGGDRDAVCLTNPIDIKFHLKRLNIKIVEESAVPNRSRPIIKKVGELPFIRSMSSFTFLVGIKMAPSRYEEDKNGGTKSIRV